jgi:hypothetical protein
MGGANPPVLSPQPIFLLNIGFNNPKGTNMVTACTKFINPDTIRESYPSLFATTHDGKRSDRYSFVSTAQIIENMYNAGMGITSIRAPKSRISDPEHNKHEISFASLDDSLNFTDPRIRVINHGNYHLDSAIVRPELRIINSSNGSCSFQVFAGLMAQICANGLVIMIGDIGSFALKHLNFNPEDAYKLVDQFQARIPQLAQTCQTWGDIQLSDLQRSEFASQARNIRWEDKHFDPQLLLNPRRAEDTNKDLWTTYNVVQENVLRGGFRPDAQVKSGRKARMAREIQHIGKSNEINEKLWTLAATFSN